MIPNEPQNSGFDAEAFKKENDKWNKYAESVSRIREEANKKAGVTSDDIVKARREAEEAKRKPDATNWDAPMGGTTWGGTK